MGSVGWCGWLDKGSDDRGGSWGLRSARGGPRLWALDLASIEGRDGDHPDARSSLLPNAHFYHHSQGLYSTGSLVDNQENKMVM